MPARKTEYINWGWIKIWNESSVWCDKQRVCFQTTEYFIHPITGNLHIKAITVANKWKRKQSSQYVMVYNINQYIYIYLCKYHSIDTTLSFIHATIRFSNILSSKTIVSKNHHSACVCWTKATTTKTKTKSELLKKSELGGNLSNVFKWLIHPPAHPTPQVQQPLFLLDKARSVTNLRLVLSCFAFRWSACVCLIYFFFLFLFLFFIFFILLGSWLSNRFITEPQRTEGGQIWGRTTFKLKDIATSLAFPRPGVFLR